MDEGVRKLERAVRASGAPSEGVALLRVVVRNGGEEPQLASALISVASNVRAATLAQVDNIPEERRAILQVMALLLERVDNELNQIHHALTTMALFEVNPDQGDVALPEPEQVLESIRSQLTPRQAQEVLQFKEPRLVIYPITNAQRYVQALNCEACRTMEGQQTPYLSDFTRNSLNALAQEGKKIPGYRWAIVDGAQRVDIPEWDSALQDFRGRIGEFDRRYQDTGVQRLNFGSAAVLMMDSLVQAKPLGCEYEGESTRRDAKYEWQYTLLQEIDEENGLVGVVDWNPNARSVNLSVRSLVLDAPGARLRSAVMGQIDL